MESSLDSANNNHFNPSHHDSLDIFYKSKVWDDDDNDDDDNDDDDNGDDDNGDDDSDDDDNDDWWQWYFQLPDLISSTPHPARPTPMVFLIFIISSS